MVQGQLRFSINSNLDNSKPSRDRWSENINAIVYNIAVEPITSSVATMTTPRAEVKNAKTAQKKVPRDYWLLQHYDILEVQGVEKLIVSVTD
ncbi:hypothetical protein TNCV_4990451 [Trichonephila clavipes]|nr:hypothetical protein TNCV_4990451 [Trichonephila clavipes]